jgi:hypothetical protein
VNANGMNRVINFFDYIFYRIYSFFNKRKDDIADEKATSIVAIIQVAIILDILVILMNFNIYEIPEKFQNKWYAAPFLIIIYILNYYRYKKKFKKTGYALFHEKWGNETRETIVRNGWLIVFFIFFVVFGAMILMAIL